jgi:hypothetical protein
MYKTLLLSLFVVLAAGAFSPVAQAASFPLIDSDYSLVPDANELDPSCLPGAPLSFGAVMEIAQRFVNLGISLGIFFFVIILAWAGFLFMISATNPESRSKAKKMLLNAAIGLMIILSAWLMVDFIMKALYSGPDGTEGRFGPWNSILGDGPACVVATTPNSLFSGAITAQQLVALSGTNDGSSPDGVVQNGAACPGADCVNLSPEISCSASGCKVDKGLKQALVNMKARYSSWTVTEAYPKSRNHRAACHSNGTCVDVGLRPQTYTVATVTAFANAAKAAGLRAVFESKSQSLVDAVKRNGVNAVYLGEWISADHFSVYSR